MNDAMNEREAHKLKRAIMNLDFIDVSSADERSRNVYDYRINRDLVISLIDLITDEERPLAATANDPWL